MRTGDENREARTGRNADPLPRSRGRVEEGAARFRPRGARNLELARRLRREMTDAERKLWQALRAHRFHGLSIRRQAMVGSYVVDFLCETKAVVVEVDGGQHYEPDGAARDAARTRALPGVLAQLSTAIALPPPNPPPQAGEGFAQRTRVTP